MIKTDSSKSSLKEIRERDKAEKDKVYRDQCETILTTRIGGDSSKIAELSNKHKGLWYLWALNEEGNVDKLLVLKPIDRNILSYASTKIVDEGLYTFLEAAMNECILKEYSDMDMMTDDEYFIPAANSFNKIMDGKKTGLLKR